MIIKSYILESQIQKVSDLSSILFYGPNIGLKKFFIQAKKNGVDGIIIVDLPPEEYYQLSNYEKKYKIDLIRLVTPTTDQKRLKMILNNSSGFIYYVSIMGITGTKTPPLLKVKKSVKEIKKNTNLPVLVLSLIHI